MRSRTFGLREVSQFVLGLPSGRMTSGAGHGDRRPIRGPPGTVPRCGRGRSRSTGPRPGDARAQGFQAKGGAARTAGRWLFPENARQRLLRECLRTWRSRVRRPISGPEGARSARRWSASGVPGRTRVAVPTKRSARRRVGLRVSSSQSSSTPSASCRDSPGALPAPRRRGSDEVRCGRSVVVVA